MRQHGQRQAMTMLTTIKRVIGRMRGRKFECHMCGTMLDSEHSQMRACWPIDYIVCNQCGDALDRFVDNALESMCRHIHNDVVNGTELMWAQRISAELKSAGYVDTNVLGDQ